MFTQPLIKYVLLLRRSSLSAVFSSSLSVARPPVSRATSFYDLFHCCENERRDERDREESPGKGRREAKIHRQRARVRTFLPLSRRPLSDGGENSSAGRSEGRKLAFAKWDSKALTSVSFKSERDVA